MPLEYRFAKLPKKLGKKKSGARVFRCCDSDKGYAPLTARPFEKGRSKLLIQTKLNQKLLIQSFWVQPFLQKANKNIKQKTVIRFSKNENQKYNSLCSKFLGPILFTKSQQKHKTKNGHPFLKKRKSKTPPLSKVFGSNPFYKKGWRSMRQCLKYNKIEVIYEKSLPSQRQQ